MVFCPGDAPEMLGFADTEQKIKGKHSFLECAVSCISSITFQNSAQELIRKPQPTVINYVKSYASEGCLR